MEITKDTRISEILENYGDIADVMEVFGVKRVGRYSPRMFLAKALTVEWAARVQHDCEPNTLRVKWARPEAAQPRPLQRGVSPRCYLRTVAMRPLQTPFCKSGQFSRLPSQLANDLLALARVFFFGYKPFRTKLL